MVQSYCWISWVHQSCWLAASQMFDWSLNCASMKILDDGSKFCCGADQYCGVYPSEHLRPHLRIHVLHLSHCWEMHALLSCCDDRRKTHHQALLYHHLTAISRLPRSQVSTPLYLCDVDEVHLMMSFGNWRQLARFGLLDAPLQCSHFDWFAVACAQGHPKLCLAPQDQDLHREGSFPA